MYNLQVQIIHLLLYWSNFNRVKYILNYYVSIKKQYTTSDIWDQLNTSNIYTSVQNNIVYHDHVRI